MAWKRSWRPAGAQVRALAAALDARRIALHRAFVAAPARRPCRGRAVGAADRHAPAIGELVEAGGGHALAGLKTGGDHRLVFVLLRDGDRPPRDGLVLADHDTEQAA